jgi:amidase
VEPGERVPPVHRLAVVPEADETTSLRGHGPADAFLVGPEELLTGAPDGPLCGTRLAVKDLVDVAGHPTTAGCPDWPGGHRAATYTAPAVQRLVDAGATAVGKVVTDELAWSLFGTNPHHGTPGNPTAPGRVPGGSSSGAAAAVASRAADLGLGTDTGGSIRVPASFCGLIGMRPTHGRVPADGVVPLAVSLDTVGWLAVDPALALAAGRVLLGHDGPLPAPTRLLVATDAMAVADAEVTTALELAVGGLARRLALTPEPTQLAPPGHPLADLRDAYRIIQGREAFAQHGAWVAAAKPGLGAGVASRFAAARAITDDELAQANTVRTAVRTHVDELLVGGAIVALPGAPVVAPEIARMAEVASDVRTRMVQVGATASLAGAPALVLPTATTDGLPVGLCLVAAPDADARLLGILDSSSPTRPS